MQRCDTISYIYMLPLTVSIVNLRSKPGLLYKRIIPLSVIIDVVYHREFLFYKRFKIFYCARLIANIMIRDHAIKVLSLVIIQKNFCCAIFFIHLIPIISNNLLPCSATMCRPNNTAIIMCSHAIYRGTDTPRKK